MTERRSGVLGQPCMIKQVKLQKPKEWAVRDRGKEAGGIRIRA